jgi:hypothetical protein
MELKKSLELFEREVTQLNYLIEAQKVQMQEMQEKNNTLSCHLHYYKEKAKATSLNRKAESMPFEKAVVKVVNELVKSQQQYKLMKATSLGMAVAKAIFDPEFIGGDKAVKIMALQ